MPPERGRYQQREITMRSSHLFFLAAPLLSVPVLALPVLAEEPAPVDQAALTALAAKDAKAAFLQAFDAGDELTEATFTSARGVGAKVREGQLFTRMPRADLAGDGEWAAHEPRREGGPQAQACITCHAAPYANGAGGVALNVAIDPLQTGDPNLYLERNTLHLFALGAVQKIAEEMTAELQDQAGALALEACERQTPVTRELMAKGVSFGALTATASIAGQTCTVTQDTSAVAGVDEDLVVRMFGWKGTHATIRDFSRGAAHNELGMQADELVGAKDGDHDGVTGELSVGDMTALAIYIAGLERPVSKIELADHGLMELTAEDRAQILTGESLFFEVGCADCHRPVMTIDNPVFSEPSPQVGFHDAPFPSGEDPKAHGLKVATPVRFDLTADTPNNHVEVGGQSLNLGAFERDAEGRALVRWYSDFRRHDMGPGLADPIDAYGFGASVWPTRSLAGVGSTGPWLHHGYATTLDEAIRAHGGDAQASHDAYAALDEAGQDAVIAFLENLVIVNLDPEKDEEH